MSEVQLDRECDLQQTNLSDWSRELRRFWYWQLSSDAGYTYSESFNTASSAQ